MVSMIIRVVPESHEPPGKATVEQQPADPI